MFGLLSKVVDVALQPIRDTADILDGLSEGELRIKAISRLGADVVGGMALSEVVEYLNKD